MTLLPDRFVVNDATTKTKRLLLSFQGVELRPEHYNHGDQGPYLRDFGFAPAVASALIRWGDPQGLVCWFEDGKGRTDGRHCWKPEFLLEACDEHLERFGPADLPDEFLRWHRELREQQIFSRPGAHRA